MQRCWSGFHLVGWGASPPNCQASASKELNHSKNHHKPSERVFFGGGGGGGGMPPDPLVLVLMRSSYPNPMEASPQTPSSSLQVNSIWGSLPVSPSLTLPDPRCQPVIIHTVSDNGLAMRVWQRETSLSLLYYTHQHSQGSPHTLSTHICWPHLWPPPYSWSSVGGLPPRRPAPSGSPAAPTPLPGGEESTLQQREM